MTRVAQYDGRGQTDKRERSSAGARGGGPARRSRAGTPPPAARPVQVWQRRTAGIQTVSTAPVPSGQPLNGMHMGSLLRRCQHCVDPRKVTRADAAAWEPRSSFHPRSTQEPERDLSAAGKSHPISSRAAACRVTQCVENAGLRPMRTSPPQSGNQHSFRRTHVALPGAIGVDIKEGRGDPRTGCPGRVRMNRSVGVFLSWQNCTWPAGA